MFKTAALISTAALTLAAISSPALAQSFSPVSSTANLSGTLNLQQTQNINCATSIDLSIDASGVGTVTGRSFGPGPHWTCGWIVTPLGTWTVTPGGPVGGSATLRHITASVGAQSIAGTCFGSIAGTYDNSTGELKFVNAVIPSTDPQDCIVNGSLFADSAVTITP